MANRPLFRLLWLFLFWRFFIYLVAFVGLWLLNPHTSSASTVIQTFANWDGGHYLTIAKNGYIYNIELAFLPIYPLLIKLASLITLNHYLIAAIIVSNLNLFLFLVLFYNYCRKKFSAAVAWRSSILLLFFPTSFFLGSVYSESTFLLLGILAIYLSNPGTKLQHRWSYSWIAAMLASLTRVTGFLIGLIVVARYAAVKKSPKVLLLFLLTFSGFLLYMLYLQLSYGNPLIFGEAQVYWSRQLFPTDPFLTIARYHQQIFTWPIANFKYLTDYTFTVIFLLLSVFVYRNIDRLLGLYSFLVILIPVLSGTLDSMPRLCLSAFPVFILLGVWTQKRWVALITLSLFIPLLILFTILFTNHYWVA